MRPLRSSPSIRYGPGCWPIWPSGRRPARWPRGSGSPARSSATTCAPSSSTALVELAEERKRGGITERLLRATAASYVVFPAALDENAVNPDLAPDRI